MFKPLDNNLDETKEKIKNNISLIEKELNKNYTELDNIKKALKMKRKSKYLIYILIGVSSAIIIYQMKILWDFLFHCSLNLSFSNIICNSVFQFILFGYPFVNYAINEQTIKNEYPELKSFRKGYIDCLIKRKNSNIKNLYDELDTMYEQLADIEEKIDTINQYNNIVNELNGLYFANNLGIDEEEKGIEEENNLTTENVITKNLSLKN